MLYDPRAAKLQVKKTRQTRNLELTPPCSLPSGGQLCVADPWSARRAAKRDGEFKKQQRDEMQNRILAGLDTICNTRGSQKHVDEQLSTVCKDLSTFLDGESRGQMEGNADDAVNRDTPKANDWFPACAHLSSASPSRQGPDNALGRALEVMRTKPDDPTAQAQSCEVLWYLAEKEETCAFILAAGGPDAISRSMKLHPTSLWVQESGCDAIRRLASIGGPVARRSIVAAGCIETIVAAMNEHSSQTGLQEAACGALEQIIEHMLENKVAFVEAQAVEAVIAAMLRNPSVMKVQWAACDTLGALILDDLEDETGILMKVIEANGIEALAAAWQRFHLDLQLVLVITDMLRKIKSVSSDAALRIQVTFKRNRMRSDLL